MTQSFEQNNKLNIFLSSTIVKIITSLLIVFLTAWSGFVFSNLLELRDRVSRIEIEQYTNKDHVETMREWNNSVNELKEEFILIREQLIERLHILEKQVSKLPEEYPAPWLKEMVIKNSDRIAELEKNIKSNSN